jgi:hypothetical protein
MAFRACVVISGGADFDAVPLEVVATTWVSNSVRRVCRSSKVDGETCLEDGECGFEARAR